MKNSKCCPKCHSENIVRVPDNPARYASGNNIYTTNMTLFGKIPVIRYVCCNCGYVENWVENRHELVEIKKTFGLSWDIEVHEKVYQRLANEIFFRILRGEYALGAKPPSYIDFAKEAGSSPETVRKAIRELQQQGVVEKTRQGYFVTSDEATVTAFRERYLASVEKEYQNARGKVET